MTSIMNDVFAGLANGAIYACIALAIVMIYGSIDHLNFAQGEMAMFSTFVAWQLIEWGVPYWITFVMTIGLSFVGGIILERVLFRPVQKSSVLVQVACFIALFSIINSLAGLIWNFSIKQFPTPFGTAPFLGSRLISAHQMGMIVVTLGLLGILYGFFRFSRVGLAMRAASTQPDSATLVGINVSAMSALGWGLASAIGAVAGMLIAPIIFLEPNMMGGVLLYGFLGAVVGGLGNSAGAVAGGFIVGVAENLIGTLIPGVGNELKLPVALAMIVAVLVLRPSGLFSVHQVQRV